MSRDSLRHEVGEGGKAWFTDLHRTIKRRLRHSRSDTGDGEDTKGRQRASLSPT
jgi:hypothetical protein